MEKSKYQSEVDSLSSYLFSPEFLKFNMELSMKVDSVIYANKQAKEKEEKKWKV